MTIVDNGEGTTSITHFVSGGAHYHDQNGKAVIKDPGQTSRHDRTLVG